MYITDLFAIVTETCTSFNVKLSLCHNFDPNFLKLLLMPKINTDSTLIIANILSMKF